MLAAALLLLLLGAGVPPAPPPPVVIRNRLDLSRPACTGLAHACRVI